MSHALYLLDPDPSPVWAPFAGARPISELRAGAQLIRERWETFAGTEATAIFALPHLAGFVEPGVPVVKARHPVPGPAVIGSSTFVPRGLAPPLPAAAFRLSCQGVTVGDDVHRSVVWSESEHLAVVGIEDMVVVRANGHTLVIPTGRAERLKELVQRL